MKLHDGTVKNLKEVRFIPEMKTNLISLGALEASGYTITLKDGGLKVSLENLVVMKGIRRKNLYFLQGSAVTGRAMTTTSDEDTTRLWHMRLGHPGIRSLQGLVSQGLLKGVKSLKMDFCEHCTLGKQTRVKFAGSLH